MPDIPTSNSAEQASEPTKSLWEKLGAAIPVAMAAIATTLAGMSTGALSQSMYWRSTAAQDQAKTNDQWSFAQAKRIRAQICYDSKRVQEAIAGFAKVSVPTHTKEPPEVNAAAKWLATGNEPPVPDAGVAALLDAMHARQPETQVLKLARKIKLDAIEPILNEAVTKALAVEDAWKPERKIATSQTEQILKRLSEKVEPADRAPLAAQASAARAIEDDVDDRRYRAESTMNFWVGYLYEVRVKVSTATSDRHLERSQSFFIAMLIAQIGSVLSSLAMNRKSGGMSVAALVLGLAAVGFGVYVFLAT